MHKTEKEILMKNIILSMAVALAAINSTTPAEASPSLAICHNPYALCASSATVAVPGKTVTVNGNVFPMGISVCPVLKGERAALVRPPRERSGACSAMRRLTPLPQVGSPLLLLIASLLARPNQAAASLTCGQ
jgi:hypothetical protein